MESQIQAQVLGVSSRQSRNGQHTMYDVQLSDGNKYTTFQPELAQKAASLQGQQVAANVSVEQKPGNGGRTFTNFNLLDLGPVGTLPAPVPQAQGVAIPAAQPAVFPQAGITPQPGVITPAPQGGGGGGGMSLEDKARITRLSAAGTAFDFVSRLFAGAGPEAGEQAMGLARAVTEKLVNYGHNGAWEGVPATPAQIAQAVPGVQVGVQQIEQQQQAAQVEPTQAVAAQGSDIPWDDPQPQA